LRLGLPQNYETSAKFPARYQNGANGERDNHSSLFNPYLSSSSVTATGSNADRTFPASELFYLNSKINGDVGMYAKSQLGQLVNRLQESKVVDANYLNPRFQITPISNDLSAPGWRPYKTPSGPAYTQTDPLQLPTAANPHADSFPGVNSAAPVDPQQLVFDANWRSEFYANWRSIVNTLGPIDLNRKLTDYRTDPAQPFDADISGTANGAGANAARARQDRERLAQDIFDRLAFATGARLNPNAAPPAEGTPEHDALHALAQLAVNIVDYIDTDDYMTPFKWKKTNDEIVWGTELPRLVINEIYTRWRNDPTDPFPPKDPLNPNSKHASKPYKVQTWVELHNPLTPPDSTAGDINLSHKGAAPLMVKSEAAYRLIITKKPNTKLRDVENHHGDPDDTLQPTEKITIAKLGRDNAVVLWSDGTAGDGQPPTDPTALDKTSNKCFHLVGPGDAPGNPMAGSPSTVKVTHQDPMMEWNSSDNNMPVDAQPEAPTYLLQRLAHPHLPFDQITNPYITVDYVDGKAAKNRMWDARQYDSNGKRDRTQNGDTQQASLGRVQPYTAAKDFWSNQSPIANADNDGQVKETDDASLQGMNHSFYKHNGPIQQPFEWLTHLDRSLISPIELFCVSAWKPHELTQQFFTGTQGAPVKHQHLANWNNNIQVANTVADHARLYRAIELLQTRNRTLGMGFGGRIPGKVNINTIWEDSGSKAPTLNALAAPNEGSPGNANFFTVDDIRTRHWPAIVGQRSPMIGNPSGNGAWTSSPTGLTDKPFMPASVGYTDGNDPQFKNQGLASTLLDPTYTRATQGDPHPYTQLDLLNKIYNNTTTRSNTFIVYCTIGYFEVTNSGPYTAANRPKLGAELGRDDGTNIRHKFFAVVDRTNLTIDNAAATASPPRYLQGEKPVFLSYEPVTTDLKNPDPDTSVTRSVPVRVPATGYNSATGELTGFYDGVSWSVKAGDNVLVDIGARQEKVPVTAVSYAGAGIGGDVTLNFGGAIIHDRGCIIQLRPGKSILGNPGPQPGFNYKDPRYAPVVPFVAQLN